MCTRRLSTNDTKCPISSNYKDCRLLLLKEAFHFQVSLYICCVKQRCLWVDELTCTVGDEKAATSGGTAECEKHRRTVDACSRRTASIMQTHTRTHLDVDGSACSKMLCVLPLYCTYTECACVGFHVQCSCSNAHVWVCAMIAPWVNRQKRVLALMKGCCRLCCRSVTVRAPRGFRDRLFFCVTLNKRVQCINLTLLGETKYGPLIQYNNSTRMRTWVVSAIASYCNIINTAQCTYICDMTICAILSFLSFLSLWDSESRGSYKQNRQCTTRANDE